MCSVRVTWVEERDSKRLFLMSCFPLPFSCDSWRRFTHELSLLFFTGLVRWVIDKGEGLTELGANVVRWYGHA